MSGLTATAVVTGDAVTSISITGYTIGQRYVEVTVNEQTTYVEQENYSNKEITIAGNAQQRLFLVRELVIFGSLKLVNSILEFQLVTFVVLVVMQYLT